MQLSKDWVLKQNGFPQAWCSMCLLDKSIANHQAKSPCFLAVWRRCSDHQRSMDGRPLLGRLLCCLSVNHISLWRQVIRDPMKWSKFWSKALGVDLVSSVWYGVDQNYFGHGTDIPWACRGWTGNVRAPLQLAEDLGREKIHRWITWGWCFRSSLYKSIYLYIIYHILLLDCVVLQICL